MNRIAKYVAMVVLAAFVPGSVLSAAPMVWCAAGGNHAATEIKLVKRWHTHVGADDAHRLHAIASTSFNVDGHSHPCLDYELIALAVSAKVDDLDAAATTNASPSDAAIKIVLADPAPISINRARAPPRRNCDPPHLASIRTTILRL